MSPFTRTNTATFRTLFSLNDLTISTHDECGTVVITSAEPRATLSPETAREIASALMRAASQMSAGS
ncbi:hypothetical protein [Microbacterium sp. A84]|uniref:hypothetical protein n=1 Tax=Microbacterium sp. A84 TaxID=3450715 RepID=UPI003F42F1EE